MQNLNNKLNIQNIIEEGHLIKKSDSDDEANNNINNEEYKKRRNNDNIKKLLEFENLHFDNPNEQKNIEQMLIRIEDQEDVQAMKNLSKEMLDNYEKEHNEMQFFKEDKEDENNPNDDLNSKSGSKVDGKECKEREIFEKLKPIDKFALNYYRDVFTYKEFVSEKEKFQNNTNNYNYLEENEIDGENSNINEDEDIDMTNEEESNNDNEEINKLDIETAYNLYLKKKDEILRMYEQMESEERIHEDNNEANNN
jgi:hypothetical protein